MKADGVEIIRNAAESAFDDTTEVRCRKIPPRGIGVKAAQRQRRFLVLKAKRGVKAPLNQPGLESVPVEPCITSASLETVKDIHRENDAGFDVVLFHLVEIKKGKFDHLRIFVGKCRERPQISVTEMTQSQHPEIAGQILGRNAERVGVTYI